MLQCDLVAHSNDETNCTDVDTVGLTCSECFGVRVIGSSLNTARYSNVPYILWWFLYHYIIIHISRLVHMQVNSLSDTDLSHNTNE